MFGPHERQADLQLPPTWRGLLESSSHLPSALQRAPDKNYTSHLHMNREMTLRASLEWTYSKAYSLFLLPFMADAFSVLYILF